MTSGRTAALLATATLVMLAALMPLRTSTSILWGDEGTYVAMAESLVADHDLQFDDRDRLRLEALGREDAGAATVILQRAPDGSIAYSKPLLYPVLAAPFVALLGRSGPLVLNALALALALALAFTDLRQRSEDGRATLVLVTFAGAGVVLPYVLWRMSDVVQMAFVLAGLTLCLRSTARAERDHSAGIGLLARLLAWRGAPYLGSVLLGAAITLRINNLALAAVPMLAAIFAGELRRAVKLAGATAAACGLLLILGAAATGASLPYRAERSSFNQQTGYPTRAESKTKEPATFDAAIADRPATHHTGILPTAGIDRSLYAAGYFLFGRHTGLLIYFPAALALGLAALRHRDAAGLAALLGFAGSAIFFLFWMPWNYFGGNTFIGNRYLLSAYPALLLAPRRLPGNRALGVAWLLALVAYGSAWWSASVHHELDRSSQNHTRAGIFRLLPYESVARDLSGIDRYWGEHFVRFVDPFADVGAWHFELSAGRPPSEILIAQWQTPGPLRFLVETAAPQADLTVGDWHGRRTFPVGANAREGASMVVDVQLAPSWRKHRFWWHLTQEYSARVLRLGVETPDGSPATARLRLLGESSLLEAAFAYERLAVAIPERAVAGGTGAVAIDVRNTGGRAWSSQAVTPVFVRQRLTPVDGGAPIAGRNALLPGIIEPTAAANIRVIVSWPETPGRYTLELDLVLGHVGTFASRLGKPLVAAVIDVEASIADNPAGPAGMQGVMNSSG